MPFGIHKHSNRSKQALNDSAVQGTATPSNSESSASSPVFASSTDEANLQPHPQSFSQQSRGDTQSYSTAQGTGVVADRGVYQKTGDTPARSQSTRYHSSYSPQLGQQTGGSVEDVRRIYQQQQQPVPVQRTATIPSPVPEPKKSKSLFDRMRSSSKSASSEQKSSNPPQSTYNNTSGLARRLSKRQETPPVLRTQQRNSLDQQQRGDWHSPQDSRSHLPSPQEGVEDDSGLDPYLVTSEEPQPVDTSQDHIQHPTIRPVLGEVESSNSNNEDPRQQFQGHQHQQSLSQAHHQQQTEAHQSQYQQYSQQQQHLTTNTDSLGIIHDQYRQQNPETVSQLSYESPIEQGEQQQQRPVSVQSNSHSPTGVQTLQRQEYPSRTTSIQGPRPLSQYTAMAPSTGAAQPNRKAGDTKQTLQPSQGPPDSRDGPPPGYPGNNYRGQPYPGNSTPTAGPGQSPIPPVVSNQGPNYRGGPPQREQYGPTGGGEQGRSTPPPAPGERNVDDAYKELLQKYKKVKGLYFDKTAQVEQLQNTLANQRLSQSRTSLDDSEYMTRFQRLDGATTNLAFNIRKNWRSIPGWIAPYVNQDALKVGKHEMTAVGRAFITKFLVDEIFNKTFHPCLEGDLSTNLKSVEQNIRRFSPVLNNQEESDALTAKVIQWRLSTLDGLKDVLNNPESEVHKKNFLQIATSGLTANLITFLQEPVPAGIEDSARMIVELAVSIASNIPLESRDISIIYPLPGDPLQPAFMKVETGVPLLENPSADASGEVDTSSTGSGEKDDSSKETDKSDGKIRKDKPKGGMLQAMMGGNNQGAPKPKQGASSQGNAENSGDVKGRVSSDDGPQKVRFAGFVGIDVRGRQMLIKAPVWTIT